MSASESRQVLDKLDLTNAQKRDERFYPKEAVVVFNQKIREAEPGTKGKLSGIVKAGLLIDVGGRFVTVSNKMLDRISVCLTRECQVSTGDRLHLKAKTGIELKPTQFRALLKENDFVCRRPKHDLTNLQDATARQAAEEWLQELKKVPKRARSTYSLWTKAP